MNGRRKRVLCLALVLDLVLGDPPNRFHPVAWMGTGIAAARSYAPRRGWLAQLGYGVLLGAGIALRGLFLIDKEGIVRHEVINDLPLGRSVDEALRMVDALQFTEKHGDVCPANWKEGDDAMQPTAEGVAKYLAKNA